MKFSIRKIGTVRYIQGWNVNPHTKDINGIIHTPDYSGRLIFNCENDMRDALKRIQKYNRQYEGVVDES